MRTTTQVRRPDPSGYTTAPPGTIIVRFVTSSSPGSSPFSRLPDATRSAASGARPMPSWNAWSAWPNHPAILPPLPRPAKSDALAAMAPLANPRTPAYAPPTPPAAPQRHRSTLAPASAPTHTHGALRRTGVPHAAQPAFAAPTHTAARRHGPLHAASAAPMATPRQPVRAAAPTRAPVIPARPVENLAWPRSFDDWMIDIVRRRALRLNSGARRRGVSGSVRAVELGIILERSADEQGRWRCAICHDPVTLQDLSFDHVLALADGGEHAAHNLVPAHRKCNEIKGSEKAQYRAKALDRWLTEWATSHSGATPKGATRYPPHLHPNATDESERRYA